MRRCIGLGGRTAHAWCRADDPRSSNDGASWLTVYLLSGMAGTVHAATSESQRNFMAERMLALMFRRDAGA